MSIYKRVSGNLVVETIGNTDSVTFQGLTANTATVIIDGNLTVTGNASLTGNIAGDKIFNGTTSIEIQTPSGNANISVGGVTNVMVISPTQVTFAGNAAFTGNVSAANLNTTGLVSATGNVNSGNLNTAGNIIITRDSSVSQPTIRFYDTDTTLANGTILGALEWYTTDTTFPDRVTTSLRSVATGTAGNAQFEIQMSTGGTGAQTKFLIDNQGNVGIANTSPLHTLAVNGTMYGTGSLQILGNITGGNINTTGSFSTTGNIIGGNLLTTGLISAAGNITGGNLSVAGGVVGGAGGVSVTGNVTGGNVLVNGIISASGNLTTTDITATTLSATGNITGGNLKTTGISNVGTSIVTGTQTVTGNITGANVNTGILSASGNIIGLNVNTGLVSATGNVVSAPGGFFIGDGGFLSNITVVSNVSVSQLSSGTTNWTIRGAGGNITADIGGASNTVVFYGGGVDITGAFSAAGNVTGANINTAGLISATGNIIGGNVSGTTGTFTNLIGNANATNLTSGTVPSDRLTGQYTININGSASTANTVTVNAQPNITSVGTLSSLTVTGNITGGNLLAAGLSLSGNVLGNLLPSANVTYDLGSTTQAWRDLYLSGTSIKLGAQTISSNATAVSVGSAIIATTGNVVAANFNGNLVLPAGSVISTTGNVTGGNINTGGLVSAVGNIVGGNLVTAGLITAAGNVTGNYILGNGALLTGVITSVANINSGTSNVTVVSSGGNVTVGIGGTSNVAVFATTGEYVNGLISATGNVIAGNINTAGIVSASGNIVTSGYFVGNFAGNITGNLTVPGSNTQVLFNTNGNADAVAGFVYNKGSNTLSVLGIISAQGNVIAGNVSTAGLITATGNITGGNLSVSTGTVVAGNIVNSNANGIGNIGSSTVYYNTVFAKATSAQYADLAEKFLADQLYEPGTVLVFGGNQEVTKSTTAVDHRVAGVVSTNPSYLMNSGLDGNYTVELALQGRVPCHVIGPVEKGDLLVSAPDGRARATKSAPAGTIIGKSLQNFNGELGTIEIVVGRD